MKRIVCLFRGHIFRASKVTEEGPYLITTTRCLRCRKVGPPGLTRSENAKDEHL